MTDMGSKPVAKIAVCTCHQTGCRIEDEQREKNIAEEVARQLKGKG